MKRDKINLLKKILTIKKLNVALTLVLTVCIFSCAKENNTTEPKLTISQKIKDLIYFKGDEGASTVIVNTQGGPILRLATTQFDQILAPVNTTNLLAVNVHQAQTLNPGLFTENDITFEQAIDYDAESVEMLYEVVKYFKDQGRTVYVLGISFGSFMTQELINQKGIDVADKYLIMVGRLDINEVFWRGFSEGRGGGFQDDGVTPVLQERDDVSGRNVSRIAAGLGRNRYTELLDVFTDLSKITYIYGRSDEQVGRLTDEEIQFLQSKGANVIAGEGGHSETIRGYIVQGFEEAFGVK